MILRWPFPKRETPQERLARIVRDRASSFEIQDFARRREAQLKARGRQPKLILVESQRVG